MNGSARFWDRIAERYARKPVPDQSVYERKLQITRSHFRADMQVLELGCGSGTTALSHAPFVRRIHGIAGFDIGHEWRPRDGRTIFLVARKTSA